MNGDPLTACTPSLVGAVGRGCGIHPYAVRAPLSPATRVAAGFHPHSLRTPAVQEIANPEADGVTLTGTASVVILDRLTGELVGECAGPRPDGSCPGLMAGARVPCRGARIRGQIRGSTRRFQFDVAPASAECPLRWLVESEAERARTALLDSAKEY